MILNICPFLECYGESTTHDLIHCSLQVDGNLIAGNLIEEINKTIVVPVEIDKLKFEFFLES